MKESLCAAPTYHSTKLRIRMYICHMWQYGTHPTCREALQRVFKRMSEGRHTNVSHAVSTAHT